MSSFVAPVLSDDDEDAVEQTLRPRSLDEFVGQERVKEQLSIALTAAKARGEALDHVLLAGPPGLGKTSLAHIVREELGVGLRTIAGPAVEKKDLAAIRAMSSCSFTRSCPTNSSRERGRSVCSTASSSSSCRTGATNELMLLSAAPGGRAPRAAR